MNPLPLDDAWTRSADEMEMVYVPAGEFEMGSTDAQVDEAVAMCKQVGESTSSCRREWFEMQQPAHTVELDGFWIDRTEVTKAQYKRCAEAGECEAPVRWNVQFEDPAKMDHPKVLVEWFEASAYCRWAGARLPTEAEWEYAARGPDSLEYPWGDEFDGTRLNYCDVNCPAAELIKWAHSTPDQTVDDGYEETAPVGSYPDGASWCGALDMAGNAGEWVADWHVEDYYATSPFRNPTGPTSGEYRAVRGGAWVSGPQSARGAHRYGYWSPDHQDGDRGFRCVRDAD